MFRPADVEIPRFLRARAGRLLAAVIEVTLDQHGYGGVRALTRPDGIRALAAVAGLPFDGRAQALVTRALAHGLDLERLSLTLGAGPLLDDDGPLEGPPPPRPLALPLRRTRARATTTTSPPTTAARGVVVPLARRAPPVDGALLRAMLAVSRERHPAPFDVVARAPGLGARVMLALAGCALVVVDPQRPPPPETLAFTLGGVEGAPYGVPVVVYDRALQALETLLFARGLPTQAPRGHALVELGLRVRARVTTTAVRPESVVAQERRYARAYGAYTVDGPVARGGVVPPVPRRPLRTIARSPRAWGVTRDRARALEQVDLFAP